MECLKCGSVLSSERQKCPKCNTYTVLNFTGRVSGEPKLTKNQVGEHYVYFTVDTGKQEVYCEIKQGYEPELPLKEGDEIILEGRAFLEGQRTSFRITKLINRTADKMITYHASGCLLPLIILGGTLIAVIL